MKTAIIVHGMPSKEEFYDPKNPSPSNFQFLPWLQKQLSIRDVVAQTPEMPNPYSPVYEAWKDVFEKFNIDEHTILVGHSCGGGFLVRWLSENKRKVGRVVLVEPWIDVEKELKTEMFNFDIDENFPHRTNKTTIFYGEDCHPDLKLSIDKLKNTLVGAEIRELPGKRDHFCAPTFPEILSELGYN